MMPVFSFGQIIYETIYGESLWRNQGYGVANHKFDIKNYLIDEMTEYPLNPDPVTGSCPYEFYTTDIMPLYDEEEEYNNTLKIRPYSINNYSDYTNGVSAIDLVAIAAHITNTTTFESRTPTDDAPYRYISADADYDNDVDYDDTDMLQDLLLGIRYDLERNSWEWVHKEEVEDAGARFVSSPYEFVIDYNWPGSEGIILAGLSTDEIQANNGDYFDFRTTKVGDIIANSSWTYPSSNSWICGSGTYFTGGEVETRTVDVPTRRIVRPGSIITVEIDIHKDSDIFALEIPVALQEGDFEIVDMEFGEGYFPRWNYNKYLQGLVFVDYSKNGVPLDIQNGRLVSFKIKALHEISDLFKSISWHAERPIEMVGKDESLLQSDVQLKIKDILPPDLYVEIRSDGWRYVAYIESPLEQNVTFQLMDGLGQILNKDQVLIYKGDNLIPIEYNLVSGIYLLSVDSKEQKCVAKLCMN